MKVEKLLKTKVDDKVARKNRAAKVLARTVWGPVRQQLQREMANGGACIETIEAAAQSAGVRHKVLAIIG